MPSWLLDDATTILYMLLGLAAAGLVFVWWRTRLAKYLLGAGVALLLVVCVHLLAGLVETDQKKIERSIHEMAAGVGNRDLNRVFAQISDSFRFGGCDKATFRKKVDAIQAQRDVDDVSVWDFEPITQSQDGRTATIRFRVKPHGNWGGGEAFYRCVATFVLDPDQHWRLQTFQILNPVVDETMQIPGF